MFKVNDAHKKNHIEEVEEMIDELMWSDWDYDDVEGVVYEIVDYFCKWMERIINNKKQKPPT